MWIWIPADVAEAIAGVKHSIKVLGTKAVVVVEYEPWDVPGWKPTEERTTPGNATVAALERAGFRHCVRCRTDGDAGYALPEGESRTSLRWVWTGVAVAAED